jgi:hypothetical protein
MHSRVLQNLTTWDRDRRQAEWDDHGETYPFYSDGPGLEINVSVPAGAYFVSIYEVNDDAHAGRVNEYRDYSMEVCAETIARPPAGGANRPADSVKTAASAHDPHMGNDGDHAAARVEQFFGGVYKRFLVTGPTELRVRLDRQYSFNTIFNAIMVDLPDERPVGYFLSAGQWLAERAADERRQSLLRSQWRVGGRQWADQFAPRSSPAEAAEALLRAMDRMRQWNPPWWAARNKRLATRLARWFQQGGSDLSLKGTAFYQAGLYPEWEQCQESLGNATARKIEKSLRWNGITPDNSGRGYQTIADYLAPPGGIGSRN